MKSSTFIFDATYKVLDGPVQPYGVAGIGWNWVSTNIANGPPQVGCWWDSWWGYVCNGYQPTKGSSGFAYQLGAGVEVNFNQQFAATASFKETWIALDHANGKPGFGQIEVMFIWRGHAY